MTEYVDCLGVRVARMEWADFRHWLREQLDNNNAVVPACLYIVNAHTLNMATEDPAYRRILQSAALVLNDGVGLDIAACIEGQRMRYNFNGTDLFPRLFREIAQEGGRLRVFLHGAAPDRADETAQIIRQQYSGIEVVGSLHGYQENHERTLAIINEAKPDLLLVAKGNPLQEEWIHAYAPRIRARVIVGVGALFDFMSGRVPRAPQFMRTLKLEWAYRLLLEPKRMARRYIRGNPVFVARALHYRAKRLNQPFMK